MFDKAFELLMINETGMTPDELAGVQEGDENWHRIYSTDPHDTGGETKCGISKRAFPDLDIKALTIPEIKDIYYQHFWLHYGCDKMPWAIGWTYLDCVVNHGGVPAQWLQRAVGVVADGVVGPKTMQAVCHAPEPIAVARDLTLTRRDYVEQLHNYDHFKAGWNRRHLDTLIGAVLWESPISS